MAPALSALDYSRGSSELSEKSKQWKKLPLAAKVDGRRSPSVVIEKSLPRSTLRNAAFFATQREIFLALIRQGAYSGGQGSSSALQQRNTMPPTDDSFTVFLARLGAGDDESARQLFYRFASRLIGLARVQLDRRIRQKVDPEDVLQSVFRSFFRRQAEGAFDLQGWDRLWLLLAAITANKCKRWNRHFHTRGRDVGHEVSLGLLSENSGNGQESPAGEPTAEEVALLTELVEALLRGLPAESRPILSLALEGCSVAQIVEQAGRSQRSVYRVLSQVKETLERLAAEATGNP